LRLVVTLSKKKYSEQMRQIVSQKINLPIHGAGRDQGADQPKFGFNAGTDVTGKAVSL